jgi:hypothetical protein
MVIELEAAVGAEIIEWDARSTKQVHRDPVYKLLYRVGAIPADWVDR